MKRVKTRAFSLFLVCLVFAVLLFSLTVTQLSGHDCSGEHCVLCFLQAQGEALWAALVLLFAVFTPVVIGDPKRLSAYFVRGMAVCFSTPVYNKVKLSD